MYTHILTHKNHCTFCHLWIAAGCNLHTITMVTTHTIKPITSATGMHVATTLQLLSLSLAAYWLKHWPAFGLEDKVLPIVAVDDGPTVKSHRLWWSSMNSTSNSDCNCSSIKLNTSIGWCYWSIAHGKGYDITLEEVTLVEVVGLVFIIVVNDKGMEWSKAVKMI